MGPVGNHSDETGGEGIGQAKSQNHWSKGRICCLLPEARR